MLLHGALLAIALLVSPASLTLHPNDTASFSVAGASGPLTAQSARGLVSVTPGAAPGSFDVRASVATGSDTIVVRDGAGASAEIPVEVALDAGSFPAHVALAITGIGDDAAWLWQQIGAALARIATVQPGARLAAASPSPLPSAPPPGAALSLDVPVTISGTGYYPAGGTVRVDVSNDSVEPVAPPLLIYDDDPERIDGDGRIFQAQVTAAQAVRLYFYHDDGPGATRRLIVALWSGARSRVQAIDATAGPNIDVLTVGHAVSRDALTMRSRNEGVVYDLRPGAVTVLHDIPMTPKQAVAGSIDLQVLDGGPVFIDVLSAAPGESLAAAFAAPFLPRDGHHREGVFNILNAGTRSFLYTAGGPDLAVEYGARTQAPENAEGASNGTDFGDYGLEEQLLFSLRNPTAQPQTVYLYERPLGGYVRASFRVDGRTIEVGCVRDPKQRYLIEAFRLAPAAAYQLSVASMPDGGSNLPIEIGLTGTPPQPKAPPISSPEGCFPKSH
jgi:hypothetical protein